MQRSTILLAEQLTEDMLMLIASFSGKYYKLRANSATLLIQDPEQKLLLNMIHKFVR